MSINSAPGSSSNEGVFPVYLETEVGGKSKAEFLAGLKSEGIVLSKGALELISRFPWNPDQRRIVKFARVPVRELGFNNKDMPPIAESIWSRIQRSGCGFCEIHDVLGVILAHKNEPREDFFWLVIQLGGQPFSVTVRLDGGRKWLHIRHVRPKSLWGFGAQLVFRLKA